MDHPGLVNVLNCTVESTTPARLDSYLRFNLRLSRKALRALKTCQGLWVNGTLAEARRPVSTGDRIGLWLPDAPTPGVTPEPMSLCVVYEDEQMLVLDKPPGMVTHPVKKHQSGTLANGVVYYLAEQGCPARCHPVNRLDKDTSGLVAFARNSLAHDQLFHQLVEGQFKRTYLAVVKGTLACDAGTIDLEIAEREESAVRFTDPEGRAAVTHYQVERRYGEWATLVRLRLESGRTHQIRVHMSAIGHPLMGDVLYGGESPQSLDTLIGRQALHAAELRFIRPFAAEQVELTSPLPEDMKELIHRCEELAGE